MVRIALSVGLIAGLGACTAEDSEYILTEKAAIAATQRQWVEAYNANDWQALSALFTPDAMLMPPGDSIVMGRREIAAWQRDNESGFQIQLEIDDIEVSGDIAAVYGTSCVSIPGEDGTVYDTGKYVEIRRRGDDGDWLIAADIFNSDGKPSERGC